MYASGIDLPNRMTEALFALSIDYSIVGCNHKTNATIKAALN